MREPGEKIVTFPGPMAEEYECAKRKKLPFFKVEDSELLPQRVKPGANVDHLQALGLDPVDPLLAGGPRRRTRAW